MYDRSFQHTVDWGLGLMINSYMYSPDAPYQYGPYASARTYGHGGFQSSVGCAGEAAHQTRIRNLFAAIYEDLGLGMPVAHESA